MAVSHCVLLCMQGRGVPAAPLESPPSTGYSAASKHRSEDWDGSDCQLLDWAASCPQGMRCKISMLFAMHAAGCISHQMFSELQDSRWALAYISVSCGR